MSSTTNGFRLTFTPAGPGAGTATCRVGLAASPWLGDHRVQDLAVLPGSFYLDLARELHTTHLGAPLGHFRQVEFYRPLLLTEKDLELSVDCSSSDATTVRYLFRENTPDPLALVEISREPAPSPEVALRPSQAAIETVEHDPFYARLAAHGNNYGPQFQGLQGVVHAGDEAWARLALPPEAGWVRVLDSAVQLLGAFCLEQQKPYVLQGIARGALRSPGGVWVRARATVSPEGVTGDLFAYDETGQPAFELTGTRIRFLDTKAPATEIALAATFTAEPIEPALRFWSDTLDLPIRPAFAPYNQVFQELLDPASRFHRNRSGFNVILLNLDDWQPATSLVSPSAAAFDGLATHPLPNGLTVAHLNRHETEYVYREIFEDRCYLRHGIRLPEAGTVIDIGANIGLFSLFIRQEAPRASVYAFEPNPKAFRALAANCAAYGPGLHPFNAGVSERRGQATLTAYEKSSVFSSFHPQAQEDRHAIQAVVTNMVHDAVRTAAEPVAGLVDELMADRLDYTTFECPMLSVSDIIRDHDLARIDLLKIDAEKCELDILRGIEAEHWPRIDQIVVEVHDQTRALLVEAEQILTSHGFLCAVIEEQFLTGSGLFNLYATRSPVEPPTPPETEFGKKSSEFVRALTAFAALSPAQTLVTLCPTRRTPASVEAALLKRLRAIPRVQVTGSADLLARYPTPHWHAPHAEGHVPYQPEGFAALGTSVFRTISGLHRPPYKVIVLDCDHTLWSGGCGEDSPEAVRVTAPFRHLQEFMLRQAAAGMLLAICSKNAEADVWAVFDKHSQMLLRREHLAAFRINWAPKSANLRALASELNVSPDSLIFLDDSPAECAEVRAHCPEALVLQLPADPENLPQFLDHVWAFDHFGATAEDRTRTQMQQENTAREQYRGQTATLKEFIDGLRLQVTIAPPAPDELPRVSQLTQRTNQFNFTTIRRSEAEVHTWLSDPANRALAVKVADRFGDYGLVGVVFYRAHAEYFAVDTFLLSCRVLGRGVEHQVVAELARLAVAEGKLAVEFTFHPTEKNTPAGAFFTMLAPDAGARSARLPAATLADLRYDPDAVTAAALPSESAKGPAAATSRHHPQSEKLVRLATDLATVPAITAAIEAHRLGAAGFATTDADSNREQLPDTLAGKILRIWRQTLGNPRIGLDDKFMEIGGTSLQAVQVVASLRRELNIQIALATLFECPTVRTLAEKLEPRPQSSDSINGTPAASPALSEAMARGARRKQRLARPARAEVTEHLA